MKSSDKDLVSLAPPKTKEGKKMARKALDDILESHDGNKNLMSRELGFSRNAISWWFSKGYVGRHAAKKIASSKKNRLTLKDLRPDAFAA